MRTLLAGLTALLGLPLPAEVPAPPGQLIGIGGGTRLHLHCTGVGSPAVILEAGFPGTSLDWVLVQPHVARFTRVCSYDRAGFGWSSAGPEPRSSTQIAGELRTLLTQAAIPAPFVLVGHSLGGLYARTFTSIHPQAVIGLVLVDSTHEDQWDWTITPYWRVSGPAAIRLAAPDVERPAPVQAVLRDMWATERWKQAERQERAGIKQTIAHAQHRLTRLPPIPLVVLSAGAGAGWDEHVAPDVLQGQQLQRGLAALSPLGRWQPVPGANHYIHLSQPAVVVEAIRQVVQAARGREAVQPRP